MDLEPGDIGRLSFAIDSVLQLERRLPLLARCECAREIIVTGRGSYTCECGRSYYFIPKQEGG